MFSGFMVNAWAVATMVAVVAGVVGFFTVLRGSAFVAHAVPRPGSRGPQAPLSSVSAPLPGWESSPSSAHLPSASSASVAATTP